MPTTKIFKIVGDAKADAQSIFEAAKLIQQGGLVAFPTETVYGLGANAFSPQAVNKIFAAKQRPAWDPVIAHTYSLEALKQLISTPPAFFSKLEQFIPGPLTILLDQKDAISQLVTASAGKISLRVPANSIAQQFIQAAGLPIAAPSANLFSRPSPTTAAHVLEDLEGKIDGIIDAGPTEVGVESTVLDLTTNPPTILRPGGITREQLETALGLPVEFTTSQADTQLQAASPGLSLVHYSPRAQIVLVTDESALNKALTDYKDQNRGVMLPKTWQITDVKAEVYEWGDWNNPAELAHNLFAGLRELDRRQVAVIICPIPQGNGLAITLRDRLHRASAQS